MEGIRQPLTLMDPFKLTAQLSGHIAASMIAPLERVGRQIRPTGVVKPTNPLICWTAARLPLGALTVPGRCVLTLRGEVKALVNRLPAALPATMFSASTPYDSRIWKMLLLDGEEPIR